MTSLRETAKLFKNLIRASHLKVGEDEGRIWNTRIEERLEKRPQKLGVVGKFLKQKQWKCICLEISQGRSAEGRRGEKELSPVLRQFCSLSM